MNNNKTNKTSSSKASSEVLNINNHISDHENEMKKINSENADHEMDEKEKELLQLKSNYKKLTGQEWDSMTHYESNKPIKTHNENNTANETISSKGNHDADEAATLGAEIREISDQLEGYEPGNKHTNDIKAELNYLLASKSHNDSSIKYQSYTTKSGKNSYKNKQKSQIRNQPGKEKGLEENKNHAQKLSRLGVETKKEDNLTEWYYQILTKGELIEQYDISGCYIIRPYCFAIWERIKDYLDKEIKQLGVQSCYFPMLVSKSSLEKGKTQISKGSPKVAWITKSGTSELAEAVAIRSTSESAIYPAYSKWIKSFRDLPMKMSQWNNVLQWESKHPQPFLHGREILWQEGHTAFAKQDEADDEVYKVLDAYASVFTDLLAVPVMKGRKTEKENIVGSDFTTTVETFMPTNGKVIQGATSQFLGQNFSKQFEITYEDPITHKNKYVYQNSWNITIRTIGIMIMVHSDNKGLVLPPEVAMYQAVIIPCGVTAKTLKRDKRDLIITCKQVEKKLNVAGIRVYGDYRDNYTAGWKFNNWELKGVPIRLEIGSMDLSCGKIRLIRRDTGEVGSASVNDIVYKVQSLLKRIQALMLSKATDELNAHIIQTTDWSEFMSGLDKKHILLSPFCGTDKCEDKILQNSTKRVTDNEKLTKTSVGAKSICIPFHQPRPLKPDDICICPGCKNKPSAFTLFGRRY